MFGSIGMPELIIILVIALIIFGPRKLPELGKSLGRSLNEFKKASTDLQNTLEQEIKIEEQKEAADKFKVDENKFKNPTTTTSAPPHTVTPGPGSDADQDRHSRRCRARHRTHRYAPVRTLALVALVPFPSQNRDDDRQDLPEKPGGFSPFGDHDEEPGEGRMTFLEHLDELRKRITHAVGALLVGFISRSPSSIACQAFIYLRLTKDMPGGKLIFTEPGEGFFLMLKMAALTGVLIASPYIMWQVWLFIAPGLYAKEKKLAIPFVISSSALFIGGAAFSHYVVFPAAWTFFAGFSNDFIEFMPRVDPVFGMYVKLMLALGLTFQLPVLMFVLARLGIVTAGLAAQELQVRGAAHLHRRRGHHARRQPGHPGPGRRPDGRALPLRYCSRVAFWEIQKIRSRRRITPNPSGTFDFGGFSALHSRV